MAEWTAPGAVSTGWTWVSGPSTVSVPFGHLTGAVEDGGNRTARLVIVLVSPNGLRRDVHLLHEGYRLDDHDAPGLVVVGDSTVLAAFTGHGDDAVVGIARLTVDEGSIREDARIAVPLPAPCTYAHILRVGDPQGRLLVITRSIDWKPTGFWVDPDTLEVSTPFVLLTHEVAADHSRALDGKGGRPYFVTRQLRDSALIALVEDHPSAYRNGLVVAELSGGRVCRIDGTPVRAIDDPTPWDAFATLDQVVAPGGEWVPWVQDINRDRDGRTAVAWSERHRPLTGPANERLVYRVAELSPTGWFTHPPLPAGRPLYAGEPDYAGGIAFLGDSIDRVAFVLSSEVNSAGGATVERRLYEARPGEPPDRWRLLSTLDSVMRPRSSAPTEAGGAYAVWILDGEYESYRTFTTTARALIFPSD